MEMPKLSIVILNYNTGELLKGCLKSLDKLRNELSFEVIVIDNGSNDDSANIVKEGFSWVTLLKNKTNVGFAKGNNRARDVVKADYVLFLNSDTIVGENVLEKCLTYFKKNDLGALTCKLILPDGTADRDTRRSFITPWIGLVHLFLKLDRVFPRSKLFARYWYGYIPDNVTIKVDAIEGAFFLTSKIILDKVDWFDEDYFLDGEDIDLCWKINKLGYSIIYFPEASIIHLKGATKGKNRLKKYINVSERFKYRESGVNSMEIFYRKRLWNEYPTLLNYLVIFGIRILKLVRFIEVSLFK
jgi:hypothetical protein